MQWKWYVYILLCEDGRYYTGCAWNTGTRFEQHPSKLGGKYTSKHGVKELVYSEEFEDLEQARKREIQIKNWSRAKKENLINGKWQKEW